MKDKQLTPQVSSSSTEAQGQARAGKGNAVGKRYGGKIQRSAAPAAAGTLSAAHASSVLDNTAAKSTGTAMAPAVQRKMEQGFGRSFGDVRVHDDSHAHQAASSLQASAFTVGSDVYFNKGAYAPDTQSGGRLLAHELAHVSQGNAVAASTDSVSVSSPGDPQERAADRAADAVMAGQPVPALGGPPASVVQRDGLGDLDEAAEGSWLVGVDLAEVWRRIAALSPAEKQALAQDPQQAATLGRVVALLTTADEYLRLFGEVPYFSLAEKHGFLGRAGVIATMSAANVTAFLDGLGAAELPTLGSDAAYAAILAQMCQVFTVQQVFETFDRLGTVPVATKIRLLQGAGKLAGLTPRRWESLVGFASPDDIAAMRGDPAIYSLFLQNAPDSLLGPRDRIEQLLQGAAAPAPAVLQAQVAGLSVAQKAELRADNATMERIVTAATGAVNELFAILADLDVEPKWIVYWLNKGGVVGSLSDDQWGQIVGEASDDEMSALAGWEEVKNLYEANCPEAIRQRRSQVSADDPAAFTASLTAGRVRSLYEELGPAGFLGAVTQDGMDIAGNYRRIDQANYLRRTINGIPRGSAMGSRTAANLKKWFFDCGERRLNMIEFMFSARFNVDVTPTRADSQKHNDDSTRVTRWTVEGLQASWPVMESLPPDAVEGNPSWDDYFRNNKSGNGNAYYWQNGVVMGLQRGDDITEQSTEAIYEEGGQYGVRDPATGAWTVPPSPDVDMPVFSATLRHEIGHAVDEALGIMTRWQSHTNAGGWRNHASPASFVQAILNDFGGLGTAAAPLHGYPGSDVGDYQQAMVDAVTGQIDFLDALKAVRQANGRPAPVEPLVDAGPISVVLTTDRWSPAGDGPWYGNEWITTPTSRNYHLAYDDMSTLYSFDASVRQQKMATDYQWRAPGEWFAEVYQVYYAEQEADPNAAVGGILRSRDPEAANLIANFVDRGHSPQEMRGGAHREVARTVPAPGTGRGGP